MDTNQPTATSTALDALHGWTRLWNGAYDVAPEILTPDARVTFGGVAIGERADPLSGPAAIAGLIRDFRAGRPGLVYSEVDVRAWDGFAVVAWDVDGPGLRRGGIDTFVLDIEGRIAAVRSVTGERGWPRATIAA
ncbi:hypothetical protein GCM10025864_32380 [Luteimicrobium album]|uniref:SnoaL-like domain-containing protein n=1 Tax=Luteimicrobium album TaxID=1054550 RepID=A0ABQ6I3Z6_9MICO|nr:hypothetical protein [Luteimicrobium album]GMA25479.1 hypothetical protein GCM10025864_32380 [Luteimicrobium album]